MPLYDNPGWPDLAIGTRAALFRELKAERGVLTAAQREVGEHMCVAGLDWDVWRRSRGAGSELETGHSSSGSSTHLPVLRTWAIGIGRSA